MQNIDYRIKIKTDVRNYITDSDEFFKRLGSGDCWKDGRYMNLKVMQKLGAGDNIQGDAYKACTVDKDKCDIDVALKLILPTTGDVETAAMSLTNMLLGTQLCPNLPLMYSYGKCNDCRFDKGVLWIDKTGGVPLPGDWELTSSEKRRYNKYNGEDVKCTTILNEFAVYGDIENWGRQNKRTNVEVKNILFQVFCGIYAIWRNYGATHNDLHAGNVLVHKTSDKNGVWEYIIDGTAYYCPNIGFLAVLWDLGFFAAPGLVNIQKNYVESSGFMYNDANIQGVDARKIIYSLNYIYGKKQYEIVDSVYGWLLANETLDIGHVIHKFFSVYTKPPTKPIIATYFMDTYTPNKYFENLDTSTIKRLKTKFSKANWAAIVTNRGLSVDEIQMFREYVDMQLLSRVVTEGTVVDAFATSLDWKVLSRWPDIGEPRIEQHRDSVDWAAVSRFVKLSPVFVVRNAELLDWKAISEFQTHLPASLWIEFRDRVHWTYMTDKRITNWCTAQIQAVAVYMPWHTLYLSTRTDLSVAALSQWIDWHAVSGHRPMSMDFIRQHVDKLDWDALTVNPAIDIDKVATAYPGRIAWQLVAKPSLNIMRRFPQKLDWSVVSQTIKLADVHEFEKYIDWEALQTYNTLTDTFLATHIRKLDFSVISRTQVLSDKFINKYSERLDWHTLRITKMSEKSIINNADSINWSVPDNAHAFALLSGKSALEVAKRAGNGIDFAVISKYVSNSGIDFLGTFYDKLYWDIISRTAVLSPDVVYEFKVAIDASVYKQFDKFKMADYTRLGGWVNWDNVSAHARLSAYEIHMFAHALNLRKVQYKEFDWEFFRVHRDEIDWTSVARLDLPDLFRREFYDKL